MAQENEAEVEAGSPVVSLPRGKIASVADELDSERETIEAVDGAGPKTEELSEYVKEFRGALSVLGGTDEMGHVRRVAAAGAADALEESSQLAIGEQARSLYALSVRIRGALDDEWTENDTEVLPA